MSHHSWVNGLNGAWYNGYTPTPADFAALDQALEQLVNGDGGGIWYPSAPVVVGGAGLWLTSSSYLTQGALVVATTGVPISFGDSDYFLFQNHVSNTRTLLQSFLNISPQTGWIEGASTQLGARGLLPLRVPNGATLSTVVLTFQVGASHSGIPANMAKFRVCAVSPSGVVTPMATTGVDVNGFLPLATPASGSAWYAGGGFQTATYTCTTSNVIDLAHTYFLEVVDESGTNAKVGNVYVQAALNLTGIADNRPW